MKVTSFVLATLLACVSADLRVIDFTAQTSQAYELATVTLATGDLLRVNLYENPTTGYVWRYANPYEDMTSVYSVEMDTYTPNSQDDELGLAGSGGVKSILLNSERSGTKNFELILVRTWEVEDFLETHTADGEPITISQIPNAGYKSVTVNVNQ